MMKIPVYIKMDAFDQLLLSEGVCRRLSIINCHPEVRKWNWSKLKPMSQSDNEEGKEPDTRGAELLERDGHCEVRVPAVHVK